MERITTERLAETHAQGATTVAETPTPQFRHSEVKPASDKSVAFLRKLVAERQPDADPAHIESVIAQGQSRVSKAIDTLLAMPRPEREVEATFEPRPNRYAATCVECKVTVEAEAGILSKNDDGKWEVIHRPGECHMTEFPFPYGRYAVEGDDGALKFYRATESGLFVQASDELHPLPSAATVQGVVDKIAADPQAAAMAYGREIGSCGRCGRTLTTEESRELGIGPVCLSRGWE